MSDEKGAEASFYRLLAWMSPSFPVSAYTYSHGLEWAVEEGTIADAASLTVWVTGVLRYGSGRSNAILLARAFDAFVAADLTACREIAELSVAFSALQGAASGGNGARDGLRHRT
ncbi:urease accessory UreF family protein [Breoghania sp.]|uniref:urease accessory protein UreF n=1 Tax=Breoghania sp. TaxID=2065378 RepID=UPI003204E756